MRFSILQAIYKKEMTDMLRDRRTMISMLLVPIVVFPLLIAGMTRLLAHIQERSEEEAKTMGIAVKVTTPSIRQALEAAGLQIVERTDFQDAIEKKSIAAAVEEIPGNPPEIRIYVDSSNPISSAAGDGIRIVLDELKERTIRNSLRNSGIAASVLTPFNVHRQNIAGERKMAGALWGSMLGYLLLLLMFSGGMYPIIDMTAGEKERKTIEPLLASPAARREIVVGKTLAAMTAILVTALLTLASMVYSLRGGGGLKTRGPNAAELQQMLGTIPLDAHTVLMIVLTLIPLAVFAASVMFAIALKARSFKEGQSYLTPLILLVIFPAILGGLPGFEMTPVLCLIPIFNASQIIRGILLGDVSTVNFAVTMAANLTYAVIAFVLATRMFEDESVLFRT